MRQASPKTRFAQQFIKQGTEQQYFKIQSRVSQARVRSEYWKPNKKHPMSKRKPTSQNRGKTMRSKESIAGIRGPTAPQIARQERKPSILRGDTSRIGRQIGPRKKTHAGPVKTKRVKDPSH